MFDEVDQAIVEALLTDGRASWVDIARSTGLTMATARRHGTQLLEAGLVLVSVLPTIDLFPETHRMYEVRIACHPGTQRQIALDLALRSDTRWVAIVTGEFDVAAEVLVPQGTDVASVLLDDVQRIPNIINTRTALVLGSETISDDWSRKQPKAQSVTQRSRRHVCDSTHLAPQDRAVLRALKEDGRRSFVELAADLTISETTVRRRFAEMMDRGCASVITLVQPASLGYEQELVLRLNVTPQYVAAVCDALAGQPGVHHLATVVGTETVICEVLLQTHLDTRRFFDEVLSQLPGVINTIAEIELVVYKRAFILSPWIDSPNRVGPRRSQPASHNKYP